MTEANQNPSDFNSQFRNQEMHRGKNMERKRSWVSIVIHIIVLVLTAITGYSMLKQPIFNIVFANQKINFHEIRNFQDTVTKIGNLDINLGDMNDLQHSIDNLILVLIFSLFYVSLVCL